MKKDPGSILLIAFFLYVNFSCQQEIKFDIRQTSSGSLTRDIQNNCLPVTVYGNYFAGQTLGDSNYIMASVHVVFPGNFTVQTNTINGYYFKATGHFADTGSVMVKLAGFGKPISTGINHFAISYDTTTCNVSVTVINIGPADYTLQGAPNLCMNDTLYGPYIKGVVLDTSNKIKIGVIVTTPGAYAISTDTVNGYSFSGSGYFPGTGIQSIILISSGTPANPGTNVFTVRAGSSICSFSITVLTAVPVANNDYFPLTPNSHWTYDDLFRAGDTVRRTIADTITINGNLYKIMHEVSNYFNPAQYNFRKSGSDYSEYGSVDKYTGAFQYGPPLLADIPFLKENIVTGDTWQSPEFSATATFGQVIILQYIYSCIDANAAIVLNGNAFTNVYKIMMRPQIKSVNNPYGHTNEIYLYYYAKGVGLIYLKRTSLGFTTTELQIKNWQVN